MIVIDARFEAAIDMGGDCSVPGQCYRYGMLRDDRRRTGASEMAPRHRLTRRSGRAVASLTFAAT
jgi:hypothetical protein